MRGEVETVATLLREGHPPDGGRLGEPALYTSAQHGHIACVRELLRGGASVIMRNTDGETALMAAAYCGEGACVGALLAAGADATARYYGKSAAEIFQGAQGEARLCSTVFSAARHS